MYSRSYTYAPFSQLPSMHPPTFPVLLAAASLQFNTPYTQHTTRFIGSTSVTVVFASGTFHFLHAGPFLNPLSNTRRSSSPERGRAKTV